MPLHRGTVAATLVFALGALSLLGGPQEPPRASDASVLDPRASAASAAVLRLFSEPPGPTLDDYRGLRTLTGIQLAELLHLTGFRGAAHKTAWTLAMRESTGRPLAHNDNASTGDDSYGLFQINMRGYLGDDRRVRYSLTRDSDLLDPVVNARVTWLMSDRGRDFGGWGLGPNAYRANRGPETLARFADAYPGDPLAEGADR